MIPDDVDKYGCKWVHGEDETSKLRAENAELRERLAEAEKLTDYYAQREQEEFDASVQRVMQMGTLSDKLAATEALLAEWVAWGAKSYRLNRMWAERLEHLVPDELFVPLAMPKEKVGG